MSIERLCDCPECHGYDDLGIINQWADGTSEPFMQIDRGDWVWDICENCMTGKFGCTYWQPHVKPPLTDWQKKIMGIYDPIIRQQLLAGTWLRDWDKYTENRMKHMTFKIKQERE